MAETIGSLVDKLSILGLKVHYMNLQTLRTGASPEHLQNSKNKVEILKEQRTDLINELSELVEKVMKGTHRIKVYRQFKMYNDSAYRS